MSRGNITADGRRKIVLIDRMVPCTFQVRGINALRRNTVCPYVADKVLLYPESTHVVSDTRLKRCVSKPPSFRFPDGSYFLMVFKFENFGF